MAAPPLLPSSSSFTNSMRVVCLRPNFNFNSVARCTSFFPVSLSHPKSHLKLYMLAAIATSPLRSFTVFANKEPAAVHAPQLRNQFPANIHRSDPLLDSSSHSLNHGDDFEKHLQGLFDEVKTLISTGKESDAVDLLEANYQAVKEQLYAGFSGIEEVALLDVIALGYLAVGNLKMVGSLLDMMDKVVDSLEDGETILDSVLVHMGSMYSSLRKFEKSIIMYERAIRILENFYGGQCVFLVTPLLGLAKVLGSSGRTSEAAESYQRVISIMESSHGGADSADLLLPLSGLGNLLLSQGKANEAEKPFTRILNIYSRLHGETDGRVGMALCSLAHVKCAQGNSDEAIHLYRRALQLIKESGYIALDDNVLEKMRVDLAELLHIVGRANEGRQLLQECLLINEKHKGKDHPSLATHFINLATSYSLSKNYVEAERLLRISLRIVTKTVGPDDPSITFPMLQLAVTLFNLQRDNEAEKLALEVLRIREAAFGHESLPVGEALDCLVSIQTRLGEDDDKLLELLKRVLHIQEKEFGYENEEVMVTLKKIIFYLDKLGRKQDKFPLQRRLSALRDKYRNSVQY